MREHHEDFKDILESFEDYLRKEFPIWKKMVAVDHLDMMIAFEKTCIIHVLKKSNWNQVKTAQQMGMNRNTLRSKMLKLGLYDQKKELIARGVRYPKVTITSHSQSHMEEKRV